MQSILKEHCFKLDSLHSIYLAPQSKQRFLENCLLQNQIDYSQGEKQLPICEICKPRIPCLFFGNTIIGFSNKIYYFKSFSMELISLYSLFEDVKEKISKDIDKITLEELVQLKKAKIELFKHSAFDKGFMLCSDCITKKEKVENFLMANIWQIVRKYSILLNPDKNHLRITPKGVQIYYAPQLR